MKDSAIKAARLPGSLSELPLFLGYVTHLNRVAASSGTLEASPDVQAAARAGTLLPKEYTGLNHSFAEGAGAVISTASDLATWIEALAAGHSTNSRQPIPLC